MNEYRTLVDYHVEENGSGYVSASILATSSRYWTASAMNGQQIAAEAAKAAVKQAVFGEVMEMLTELKKGAASEEEWMKFDRVLRLMLDV